MHAICAWRLAACTRDCSCSAWVCNLSTECTWYCFLLGDESSASSGLYGFTPSWSRSPSGPTIEGTGLRPCRVLRFSISVFVLGFCDAETSGVKGAACWMLYSLCSIHLAFWSVHFCEYLSCLCRMDSANVSAGGAPDVEINVYFEVSAAEPLKKLLGPDTNSGLAGSVKEAIRVATAPSASLCSWISGCYCCFFGGYWLPRFSNR